MAYAKYTFFEAATQHGYIMALLAGKVAKSREFSQIIIDPSRGRVLQVFKTSNPESPFFEFVIPERETTESTMMWRAKAHKGLEAAWRVYEREKETRRLTKLGVPSGGGTLESYEPTLLRTGLSSTDAPPKPASSSSPSEGEEPALAASGPGPSTPESSPTEPPSSKDSAPPSRKSGSRSRSSSGG